MTTGERQRPLWTELAFGLMFYASSGGRCG